MRENIIEQLRFCATHFSCSGCGGDCKTGSNEPRTKAVLNDAADAIEELVAQNQKQEYVIRLLHIEKETFKTIFGR